MNYLMSILMGFIQGVAEFLPISSSGHLTLFQAFFGMENMEETHMFFTVLLHFGTLISVAFYGEQLTLRELAGFALIFIAVILSETKLQFLKRPERSPT